MKKLLMVPVLGLIVALGAPAGAVAAETKPTTAAPFQGEKPLGLVLYVDTVVSGSAAVKQLEPLGGCAQTSIIHVGQTIVFRMWGVDTTKGGVALTEKNVDPLKGAYVVIPNVVVNGVGAIVRVPLLWGEHSQAKTPAGEANKHSYWTVGVPTKGELKEIGWTIEGPSGALTAIPEKSKIEIPITAPGSLAFSVHVVTKSVPATKVVTKKVTKKGKNGKKKVVIKKTVKKYIELGHSGVFSQVNFPLASQLVIAK